MQRPPKIKLNQFQLAILLNDEQKKFYDYVMADNVFCVHCKGTCKKGITVEDIFLDSLNDIYVRGTCNTCNGKVGRTMEFGEDKEFYNKAMNFRESIQN
ncbi:MAG: hypothetical protein ACOC12_09500 [Bacteroidota bacterium]